ncbi:MAG: molybdopterin-binding protein [Rhodocyclaceae bacterium]|nr:molybdopterin-binding protein [Rhodocyclaceae bacterium]
MAIGAIIIGDEILSGKRQDKHFGRVLELLAARGLSLAWALYLGDDRARLAEVLRRSFTGGDIVFSFGGIGATPDDHTRQAAAMALDTGLALHPDAEAEIRARFGGEVTAQRLSLGEFPLGSEIIPNPFNRIPGFSIREHYFVPGFPQMAWPMMEWVLDTKYRHLFYAVPHLEESVLVYEAFEGGLLDLMQRVTAAYPQATLFSLPSFGDASTRRHIELGMKGDPTQVRAAMAEIRMDLSQRGLEWLDKA